MSLVGLCDCNSFYASAERLFRPDLRNSPVVVLSNNDGCVVSLTKEAKALGFRRGDNWHEIRERAAAEGVAAFSSNYTLYNNLSGRVMSLLAAKTLDIFPYSIDEAFFTPGPMGPARLRAEVEGESGIPVSIGVGRTRTLAKVANHIAKDEPEHAFTLEEEYEDAVLKLIPVGEVWGIGWRSSAKLERKGVRTALALRDMDDSDVLRMLTASGMKTVLELRGTGAMTESVRNETLCSGITFSKAIEDRDELMSTLSVHCQTLSSKLGEKGLEAGAVAVCIFTSRFRDDFYTPVVRVNLETPTSYAPVLVAAAEACLAKCWRRALYKGSRVWALDITPKGVYQIPLFDEPGGVRKRERESALTSAVHDINARYGADALKPGSSFNKTKGSLTKRELRSPNYTTRFEDLPAVD